MKPYNPSNNMLDPGLVMHTCNDNTEEAEGERTNANTTRKILRVFYCISIKSSI